MFGTSLLNHIMDTTIGACMHIPTTAVPKAALTSQICRNPVESIVSPSGSACWLMRLQMLMQSKARCSEDCSSVNCRCTGRGGRHGQWIYLHCLMKCRACSGRHCGLIIAAAAASMPRAWMLPLLLGTQHPVQPFSPFPGACPLCAPPPPLGSSGASCWRTGAAPLGSLGGAHVRTESGSRCYTKECRAGRAC